MGPPREASETIQSYRQYPYRIVAGGLPQHCGSGWCPVWESNAGNLCSVGVAGRSRYQCVHLSALVAGVPRRTSDCPSRARVVFVVFAPVPTGVTASTRDSPVSVRLPCRRRRHAACWAIWLLDIYDDCECRGFPWRYASI